MAAKQRDHLVAREALAHDQHAPRVVDVVGLVPEMVDILPDGPTSDLVQARYPLVEF